MSNKLKELMLLNKYKGFRIINIFFYLLIFINGFSQVDLIKKENGEIINCKVDSINSTHIFFHYSNEVESHHISKVNTEYIKYYSGRIFKIENKEKYPIIEKESFIEDCYSSTNKNITLDTINAIKKLNYCLNSYRTIESKLSYKDMYQLTKLSKSENSILLMNDFLTDVSIKNINELTDINSYKPYIDFINKYTNDYCNCAIKSINSNKGITLSTTNCIRQNVIDKLTGERKEFLNIFFKIFKDTTTSFIYKTVGGNILLDIEKNLYDNCDYYLKEKIEERNNRINKKNEYKRDSLLNELNNLQRNSLNLDDDYFFKRGLLYFYIGEYEKSISDFNQSYSLNPKKASALYFKYELYDSLNDYDNAIVCLKELNNKTTMDFNSTILLLRKLKEIGSNN